MKALARFRFPCQLLGVCLLSAFAPACSKPTACERWLPDFRCDALASAVSPHPLRVYAYPWTDLEGEMRRDSSRILLVGYGSLLHADSARRNLDAESVRHSCPVIVMGVRRVFEYVIPAGRMGQGPPAVALNVRYTGNATDTLNGRLFRISADELAGLREREFGYDLVQVQCLEWFGSEARPFNAWLLACPGGMRDGKELLNPSLQPHRTYLQLCRDGAASISSDFAEMFEQTTFLGDGRSIGEIEQ